ncbi:MAG: PD-(D/E)XK nuclease domain-containing protein, partial [Thermodesulfovibrionales bacterium]|nr:PD-(D/E)XK nuclease domain-containing protein [Thermodesulfovibrionales bacterium]
IDITVNLPQVIYVIEFKTDGALAIEQIKSKGYHEKYIVEGKPVYLVAIEFDISKRNITDVRWERITSLSLA